MTSYRPDIDGLRALAVLAVVAFHAFPGQVHGGFIGVDIFFVISGFLISGILVAEMDGGRFSAAAFYGRRIRRIFPALLLVMAACLAAGWWLLLADEYAQLGKHVAGGAGFLANFVLWFENGYFDNDATTKPLLHLWSLGVEEQFYIFWPLLLWLAWRSPLPLRAAIGAIALLSFGANVLTCDRDSVAAFYAPHTRFWELLAGALLAGARFPPARAANALSVAGLALVAAGLQVVTPQASFPGYLALLPVAGAALLIAAGPGAWLNRRVLAHPAAVGIGLISYPLYLWHWPLLSFAHIVGNGVPAWPVRVAAVAAAFLLAWLTWRWAELPVRRSAARRPVTIALVALMLAIAAAGLLVRAQHGVPARLGLNLAMGDEQVAAERARYWSGARDANFAVGAPKVIVFGDSQAFDVFVALRNHPGIGLKLFPASNDCSAFSLADAGAPAARVAQCRDAFQALLDAPELRQADVLVYSHSWHRYGEQAEHYAVAARELRAVNPRLQLYYFGPKPLLGEYWVSINALTRWHHSRYGMNEYLNSIRWLRTEATEYARQRARESGAGFVDINAVFCDPGGCPFFVDGAYSYFDQNHWTEAGAALFYRRLMAAENRPAFLRP